jgi:NitT/TauT family transport system substrate-binding protein
LVKEGKAYYAESLAEAFGAFPETSYVATSDFIKDHPEVVQKFSDAVTKGADWLSTASKEEITKTLMPFFEGTPEDLILQSVERYKSLGVWAAKPELTEEQLEILQTVLTENGVLKAEEKVTSLDNIADMSFVHGTN